MPIQSISMLFLHVCWHIHTPYVHGSNDDKTSDVSRPDKGSCLTCTSHHLTFAGAHEPINSQCTLRCDTYGKGCPEQSVSVTNGKMAAYTAQST